MAVISNGTTIADAGAFSVNLGSMVHIKTLTSSNSGDLSKHRLHTTKYEDLCM